jgi:hypothetical protein
MIQRFGLLGVLSLGLALSVVTYGLLQTIKMDTAYWLGIFPSFALIGIAFTLVFSTVSIAATSGVPEHEHGLASGVLQTAIQFGTAVLLAATTAVYEAAREPGDAAAGLVNDYRAGWLVPLIAVSVAFVVVLATARRQPSRDVAEPSPREVIAA